MAMVTCRRSVTNWLPLDNSVILWKPFYFILHKRDFIDKPRKVMEIQTRTKSLTYKGLSPHRQNWNDKHRKAIKQLGILQMVQ